MQLAALDHQFPCYFTDALEQSRMTASICVDIRSLDGERKALVYDNYSKLIVATETIKKVCVQT